jgi:transcriptional regulator with XRE-family HTH domain
MPSVEREPAPTTAATEQELPVGRRVAYWRNRRGLTQQVLADRLGKSKSWLDKVERGARRLDRVSVLHEIAGALGIAVDELLDGRSGAGQSYRPDDPAEMADIRAALTRYTSVTAYLDARSVPPDLTAMARSTNHAWLSFQHGGYDRLSRALPKLLHEAQSAEAYHRHGDEARRAVHLLAQCYQVASSVLRKLGAYELAWFAADRSTAVSIRTDDPLLIGIATSRAGNALLALGRARSALETQLAVANRLAPADAREATPDRLSVYGSLLLQAAMAAARLGDGASVSELIREARRAAAELDAAENHYWTSFGPANVELHRIAADVELGEAGRAVDGHRRLDPVVLAALVPERRAQHLLDVARACCQLARPDDAAALLLAAERLAPAEVRQRPAAHAVLRDLTARARGAGPGPVAELAVRVGIRSP